MEGFHENAAPVLELHYTHLKITAGCVPQGLKVEGLKFQTVHNARQVMENLAKGNAKRVTAAMSMNARSSRGHAIFTIYCKEVRFLAAPRVAPLLCML